MNIKVKICGIRTMEAALAAVDAGADFLGFNFVESSRRYIVPENAKKIIDQLRDRARLPSLDSGISGQAKIVGVFRNEHISEVNKLVQFLNLDLVQLHGEESPQDCHEVGAKVIKVFSILPGFDVTEVEKALGKYGVAYYMLDRHTQGTGEMLDLNKVADLTYSYPIFFAGGLTPENVSEVIKVAAPFAVDVAGGIETNGEQDLEKIRAFIRNAKGDKSLR